MLSPMFMLACVQRANFHLCLWPPGINKLQMLLRHSGNFACFDLKGFQRTGKVLRNPRRPTGKAPALPSLKSLAAAIQPLPGAKRRPTSPMKMIPPPSSKKQKGANFHYVYIRIYMVALLNINAMSTQDNSPTSLQK